MESTPLSSNELETVATIDMGSNSFHMIVAKANESGMQVIDRMKEMVRLGEGLLPDRHLDPVVADRALACLERFGQRLAAVPSANVRAVGTNTMRQIHPSDAFITRAEQALGHPIEVIAGREEARLVYLGVAHGLAGAERRLVVDIGGGSTELIIGEGFEPHQRESLHMGCVSMTRSFFPDGQITEKAMRKAELACAVEIRPVREQFKQGGWTRAVGSSGTIKAIRTVVIEQGWSEAGITLKSLEKLAAKLVDAGSLDKLNLKGLSDERKPVFAGGVAVLLAVFRHLGIEHMQVSYEALREGLIYDMVGRSHHHDIRDRTVEALCRRYDVDMDQARRVEAAALALYEQIAQSWCMSDPRYPAMLSRAAHVHEVGLAVSHSQFQKHGAYLIENSDLSGFSKQEQRVLAALVRGHRRKFPTAVMDSLPTDIVACTKQLCTLLRLAVMMHRSRSPAAKPQVQLGVDGNHLHVQFPQGWLEAHPLTLTELEQERLYLSEAGFQLSFQ